MFKKRVIFIFLILFLLFNSISLITNNAEGQGNIKYAEHTVIYGETLWSISKKYCRGNDDPRKFIYEVKKINNLKDVNIYAGQILRIPILK